MPPNSLISIAVNSFDYLQTNLVHASVKRVYRVLFVVAHLRFTFPHPRAPRRMNDMKFAGPDYQLSPTKTQSILIRSVKFAMITGIMMTYDNHFQLKHISFSSNLFLDAMQPIVVNVFNSAFKRL